MLLCPVFANEGIPTVTQGFLDLAVAAVRVALTAAVAQGYRDFVAIAVATQNGGTPCGICRQVMAELAPAMTVLIADAAGNFRTTTVPELLPGAFRGDSLVIEPAK